jgi:uncharacterized membrane protein YdjX (TVP38/TMEM64 family)
MLARVVVVALVVAALVAFFALDAKEHLSLAAVTANRDALVRFADAHRVAAILVAFGLYALGVALCLPGGFVFAFACGLVFGRVLGTSIGVLGETAGATLAFAVSRFILANWMRRRFGPALARVDDAFARNRFWWLVFVRAVPILPYALVNIAPAFTGARTSTFALATFVAAIPATFVYANLGSTLAVQDEASALRTLAALALVALTALVPIVARRYLPR